MSNNKNKLADTSVLFHQQLYTMMFRLRHFEEVVANYVESGEIHTPCHLYIGQEGVATGVCAAISRQDTVWGGHRSHGHYLAKGGSSRTLMAEIFGKADGCSGGRGGSMHVCAPEVGLWGTVPLVAATIPLATGAALASKLRGEGQVAVSFFGDGATEEGHFHESMNLAALYRLPVLFVCENNFFASHLALLERRFADNIVESGKAHGVPSEAVDGNDVLAVLEASRRAVTRARNGEGPSLLECRTYRWRGHVGASWDLDVGVKRKGELKEWLAKDPLLKLKAVLQEEGIGEEWFVSTERAIQQEVSEALRLAREGVAPDPRSVTEHVFHAGTVS